MGKAIGFVRPPGPMGDGIRYAAVLKFLQDAKYDVKDIPLNIDSANEKKTDILRAVYAAEPWRRGRGYHLVLKEMESNLLTLRNYRHAVRTGYDIAARDDVHMLVAETHLAAVASVTARQRRGLPYVYDMHGLAAEERLGSGDTAFSVSLAERWERMAITGADHVIAVSELMREWVATRYNYPQDRIAVAANGTSRPAGFAEFHLPLRVVYGGVFAYWESVHTFLDVAGLLAGPEFEFHLIGDGPLRDQLLNRINKEELPVLYHGRKSRQTTLELFAQMQIGIAPSTNDMVRRTASPIKVLDYAACGLPIVAPNVGEWTNLLHNAGAAVVVDENTAEAMAQGVRSLSDPTLWLTMSTAGRAMLDNGCTWDCSLSPLGDLFQSFSQTKA